MLGKISPAAINSSATSGNGLERLSRSGSALTGLPSAVGLLAGKLRLLDISIKYASVIGLVQPQRAASPIRIRLA
jgi:hypothetical protein